MQKQINFQINTIPTLLVYLLLFLSSDTYLFGTNANQIVLKICFCFNVVVIAILGLAVFSNQLNENQKSILLFGILFVLLFCATVVYHGSNFNAIILRLSRVICAVIFAMRYEYESFEEAFLRVMTFNTIIAILFELLAYLAPGLVASFPRMVNTADVQISTIGFAGIISDCLGKPFIRSSSIFWEPGVFQIYLNIALIMELFNRKFPNKLRVVIFTIGVFITFSTAGYIVYTWIVLLFLLLKKKLSFKMFFTLIVIAVLGAILLSYIDTSELTDTVFGKISDKNNSNYGSTVARKASVYCNIQILLEHPIFGIGLDSTVMENEFIRRSYLLFGRATKHNTNTILYQFASCGVFFGGLFTFGLVRFMKRFSDSLIMQCGLFISFVLMFINENIHSMFLYTLVFYGYGVIHDGKESSKQHSLIRQPR